jgi:hypothetical protein
MNRLIIARLEAATLQRAGGATLQRVPGATVAIIWPSLSNFRLPGTVRSTAQTVKFGVCCRLEIESEHAIIWNCHPLAARSTYAGRHLHAPRVRIAAG